MEVPCDFTTIFMSELEAVGFQVFANHGIAAERHTNFGCLRTAKRNIGQGEIGINEHESRTDEI